MATVVYWISRNVAFLEVCESWPERDISQCPWPGVPDPRTKALAKTWGAQQESNCVQFKQFFMSKNKLVKDERACGGPGPDLDGLRRPVPGAELRSGLHGHACLSGIPFVLRAWYPFCKDEGLGGLRVCAVGPGRRTCPGSVFLVNGYLMMN